jgi:hypothetical protein
MKFNETYDEWAKSVGIFPDSESREAWEHQQEKIDRLVRHIEKGLKNENE